MLRGNDIKKGSSIQRSSSVDNSFQGDFSGSETAEYSDVFNYSSENMEAGAFVGGLTG